LTLLIWAFACQAVAAITADPHGIAVSIEAGEQLERTITLFNDGDDAVNVQIGIDERDLEEGFLEGGGPRRDQPEGRWLVCSMGICRRVITL